MKMILMGTGTSHGIPVIGCTCAVCRSPRREDTRLRCSAYVVNDGNGGSDDDGRTLLTTNIVIDTGPEFRLQALAHGISRLDGVLITHSHADHCHGLDDIRIFSHTRPACVSGGDAVSAQWRHVPLETKGPGMPIYANSNTVDDLILRFAYIFHPVSLGGGLPKLNLQRADGFSGEHPLKIGSVEIIPVPMMHGPLRACGWILRDGAGNSIVYLTDCSEIPDSSVETIIQFGGNIAHAVIDGLRPDPHPTHCSYAQALAYAERICPRHTWLTHINHDMAHADIQRYIDRCLPRFPNLSRIVAEGGSAAPAYDGLVLNT